MYIVLKVLGENEEDWVLEVFQENMDYLDYRGLRVLGEIKVFWVFRDFQDLQDFLELREILVNLF